MEKIERYIHGTINTLGCNLNCNYCYLKLQGVPQTTESKFEYSLNTIKKAMSRDRWGCCFISLCGKGETLMDSKVIDLMKVLLDNGHYINISTNGTMKKNMHIMIQSFPKDYIERTMLTISLHYNELKKRNLLDQYFSNIRALRTFG